MNLLVSGDGGGALGCGPTRVLANTEDSVGLQEGALAACSTFTIVALLRSILGWRWSKIRDTFDTDVVGIFHNVPWWWHLDPTRPKWDNDKLVQVAGDLLGDRKMSSATIPIYCAVSDFWTGEVRMFSHKDDDLARDVLLRSTAAPTFFYPQASRYADGGLVANNPSDIASDLLHAEMGWEYESQRCLSLATGGTFWEPIHLERRWASLQWVKPIIKFTMQASLMEAHRKMALKLEPNNYLRVIPGETTFAEMDDLSILPAWRALWDKTWESHGDAIKLLTGSNS